MRNLLKHPWPFIAAILAVTVFFALKLGGIRIENSMRSFSPQQHESYKKMLDVEETFGSMSSLAISLETDEPTIITAQYLSAIERITERLKGLDNVESVESLTGTDYVYGDGGALAASSLLPEGFEGSSSELYELKQRLSDWEDMYARVIISDDGRAAQIQASIAPDLPPSETKRILKAARDIVYEETAGTSLDVKFYGDPVTGENIETFMLSDLSRLVPLVSVIVLATLFLSFKTLDGTLLPLITVLISTIWTCGLMSIFDVTFTLVSSVIPVALIGVGSAYGIHVLTHYYAALDARLEKGGGAPPSREEHIEIIMAGLKDVRLAVFLAALTTAAGFASLVTSPLQPLHSFAVFSAIGVAIALILSITLIPALLAAKPASRIGARSGLMKRLASKTEERRALREGAASAKPGSSLSSVYRALCGTGGRLALFIAAICACSYFGLARLDVDSATIEYFAPDSEFRKDIDYVNEKFAGTNSLYLIVEGDEKGALTRPEILKPVDDMQSYLVAKYPEIGKAISFTTFIKRMNQVMHIPDLQGYEADEPSYMEESDFSEGYELPSFGSFSDDAFYTESFFSDAEGGGLPSFFSLGPEEEEAAAQAGFDNYVDPNIDFSRRLKETITIEEGLSLLNRAYAEAGGSRASVSDIVAALSRELNYNGLLYYEIPYDTEKYPAATREELSDLVSQYLLLFSGSLDRFADDQLAPQSIRIMLQLRVHSTEASSAIARDAQGYAERHFPAGYSIYPTGGAEMQRVMTDLIVSSQLSSLAFSLLSVFVIIAVSFRSILAGLLGAVPLALTILLNYMVMGFAGIKLDLVTSIIASVAIGVGIDYTIHFLTTYKNERALTANLNEVLSVTFAKSGRGIVTNAIAVGLGFLVLVFSEFVVLRYIGILVAVVMFSSSLLAMTVIPGFLVLFDPKFIRPKALKEGKGGAENIH